MNFPSLILISLAISITSCSEQTGKEKHYETFPVTEVITMDTATFIDYTAEIRAVQNVEIHARVSGYLDKIYTDEGQLVKEGQLLFSINDLEYTEELSKSKAQYKSAVAEMNAVQLALNNTKILVEKKVIAQAELDLAASKLEAAKAKVDEAQAQQASAQIRWSNTMIKAPFSGIVNRIPNKTGSLINEGTLLTSISKNDEVFAYFNVSEKEYLNYASVKSTDGNSDRSIALILANGKEHLFKGQIETMDGEIDKNTGNIAFRARFKNPDGLLKHGASGKVRLTNTYNNALVIPQKATFEIQDRLYVYVLDNNNIVKAKSIIPNARITHLYIIGSGLNADDKIVFEGIQNIKDGTAISPEFIPMKKILEELSDKKHI